MNSYILSKLGIDHNEHSDAVPEDYKDFKVDYENFPELVNHNRNKKRVRIERIETAPVKKSHVEEVDTEGDSEDDS